MPLIRRATEEEALVAANRARNTPRPATGRRRTSNASARNVRRVAGRRASRAANGTEHAPPRTFSEARQQHREDTGTTSGDLVQPTRGFRALGRTRSADEPGEVRILDDQGNTLATAVGPDANNLELNPVLRQAVAEAGPEATPLLNRLAAAREEELGPTGAYVGVEGAPSRRGRLLIPLALLGLAGIGSVAGYAAATRDGGGGGGEGAEIVEPVPEEDYRWGYYGGQVTPQVMSTGDVEASVKLEATKNRLRELGYDVDGPNAADEIRRFQYSAGVQQDGVIGEQTAAAARSVQRQLGRHNYDIWEDEPLPGPANEPPAEY